MENEMNKDRLRQIFVILAVVATITVNALANILPINGQGTGEISDRFQVYFVPAGYVFSIWGIIYLGWLAYAIYQALPAQRNQPRLRAIAFPFILNGLANSLWIFAWHYNQFGWTLLAMLVVLVSLIVIYLRLGIGTQPATPGQRWLVNLPFSLYLGWITVATVANVTDVLYWIGWTGSPLAPQTWAVIMLAVATLVTALVLLTRRDIAYAAVIVWAFIGIAVKFSSEPSYATIAWVAALVVALLAAASAARLLPKLPAPAHN
jgi:hypothetical protein